MLDPDQIRQARHALSLSQHELARRARVSRTALNQFEQGKYQPGLHFCRKLLDYFETKGIHHELLSEPQRATTGHWSALADDATNSHTAQNEEAGPECAEQEAPGAVAILIGLGLSLIIGRRIGL
ncbi:helix-turn-helix domain-containing protein [Chromatocurvus halotolerans]|uniref:helix-turn-helix transcriptional regulator n=1 Tax=Chromatocurvus halotolerans TaxID=1132028 RepID=UPI000E3BFF17